MSFYYHTQPLRQTGQCAGPFELVDSKNVQMMTGLEVPNQHWIQQPLVGPKHNNFLECFSYSKRLGSGGFGEVFLARIVSTGKMVALKLPRRCMVIPSVDDAQHYLMYDLLLKDLRTPDMKDMFAKEAATAQVLVDGPCAFSRFYPGQPYDIWTEEYMSTIGFELRQMKLHPGYQHMSHILDFKHDIGLPGTLPCIVMEPHAHELEEKMFFINRNGSDEHKWIQVAKQICQAVDYIHYMGFVHRDLKPPNILYDTDSTNESYHIYISDFGLTEQLKNMKPFDRDGTNRYKAPELFMSFTEIDNFVAVDIFAVVQTILNIVHMSLNDTNWNSNKENLVYAKADEVIGEISIEGRVNKYKELTQLLDASRPHLIMPFRPCYAADVHLSDDDVMSESPEEDVMSESPNKSGSDEDESSGEEEP